MSNIQNQSKDGNVVIFSCFSGPTRNQVSPYEGTPSYPQTDGSWRIYQNIVCTMLGALFLLVCGGIVGYYVGYNARFGSGTSEATNTNLPTPCSTETILTIESTTSPSGVTTEVTNTNTSTCICTPSAADCNDICSGVFRGIIPNQPVGFASTGSAATIYPGFGEGVDVYCDCSGGSNKAWTVFQRRMDGSVDFYRNWTDYVSGFGSTSGEYWLGLEVIYNLTSTNKYELRVDLEDWDGNRRFAEYLSFEIEDSTEKYRLNVGSYSGNAGDAINLQNDMYFTTKDKDSDKMGGYNCAERFKGAWWYRACHDSNLNGLYFEGGEHSSYADDIDWYQWKGHYYSLKVTEMKIRPLP